MMKKWIMLALTLLLIGTASAAMAAGRMTTTVMMYMCGTDLQKYCVRDLMEMCDADLTDDVRIVVLAGGASTWSDRRLKADRLNLFTIEDGTFSAVTDWGRKSMGDPETLERFVTYAMAEYPADRSMLILWDHGGGTGEGICFDEVHDDDGLTLVELDRALSNVRRQDSSFRLSLLGCDACMMGGYELAMVASGYADYVIASEEIEPGAGWYYTPWLNALAKDPGMSMVDLGHRIVEAYAQGVGMEDTPEYTTLSMIDTAGMAALNADLERIAAYMSRALDNGQLATISRMLGRAYSFDTYSSADESWDMYDLEDYLTICEQFAPESVQQARASLDKCIVWSYTSGDVPTASGLSIYVPFTNRSFFLTEVVDGYDLGDCMNNHVAFARQLAGTMNGSNYVFHASAPQASGLESLIDSTLNLASAVLDLIPGSSYNAENDTIAEEEPAYITGGSSFLNVISSLLDEDDEEDTPPADGVSFLNVISALLDEEEDTPPASGGSFLELIAGITDSDGEGQQAAANSLAFSLELSQDAADNLSYVEGALFMDLSDENGVFLLDLGYMRNSWVDWSTNRIYSTFDGNWTVLGDQVVVAYDQSSTGASRRSLIPVKVNDEETYLVVVFENGSTEGRILGYNDGVDDNGLPIRYVNRLEEGDVIAPVYSLLYSSWEDWEDPDAEMEKTEFDGDPIIWQEGVTVTYGSLEDEDAYFDYQFAFYLNDIFGDCEMSDFFAFTM